MSSTPLLQEVCKRSLKRRLNNVSTSKLKQYATVTELVVAVWDNLATSEEEEVGCRVEALHVVTVLSVISHPELKLRRPAASYQNCIAVVVTVITCFLCTHSTSIQIYSSGVSHEQHP